MAMDVLNKKFGCFVVDDNALDRLTTVSFLRKYPFLTIDGIFDNAFSALEAAQLKLPDAIFLDIDMPGQSGLELREKLSSIPACIFVTAYPDYALPGFEANALDFLVKPISAERFDKAMKRLLAFLELLAKAAVTEHSLADDHIFIKESHEHIKIRLQDILYLEALKDYTRIVTKEKKYCILSALGRLIEEKSFRNFIRIHRSYAVQKQYVEQVNAKEVMVNQIPLPVGRAYKGALNSLLT